MSILHQLFFLANEFPNIEGRGGHQVVFLAIKEL
jgi:hypothetical protein